MSPGRLAKELAAGVRELGGSEAAILAVFGRFVVADEERLGCLVQQMPAEASMLWSSALARFGAASSRLECDRESTLSQISRDAQPVLAEGHLFELLLRELDASGRRQRGAYFTPRPLAEFVARTAIRLADEQFAGRRCHAIDPACGYGAFLAEAAGARPLDAAMQHVTGIELCRTTWAAAHLLLSLASPRQLATRLLNVNPLAAGDSLRNTILGLPGEPLVPVILGNPPWSNFGRLNRSPWIDRLLADYRSGLAERKSNLADDAIKFIRWAQHWIDEAGAGILAFVTPNTWLAGLTHRRMRASLLESFDDLFVLDLHGETDGPGGDDNVFGIRSGVAVVVLVKRPGNSEAPPSARNAVYPVRSTQHSILSTEKADHDARRCRVEHSHVFGSRAAKFAALKTNPPTPVTLTPATPEWRLTPVATGQSRWSATASYASFWPLDRIFRRYISGVQTKNDAVFVGFTRQAVVRQVQEWLEERAEPIAFDAGHIRPYLLAPFDRRWIYYDPRLLGRPRHSVMRHMLRANLGLVFVRQATGRGEYDHFLAVDCLVSDRVFYSRHGAPFLAPLWVEGSGFGVQESGVRSQTPGPDSNFEPSFLIAMAETLGAAACQPLSVFHYLYGVAYSPTYRRLFGDELRRGFPRFPLPRDRDWFERLAALGGRLVDLHLSESSQVIDGDMLSGEAFRVGGYDVLRRWQAPRKSRGIAGDEADLARLASVGCQTRRLMRAIDEVGIDYERASPHPPPPGVSIERRSPG